MNHNEQIQLAKRIDHLMQENDFASVFQLRFQVLSQWDRVSQWDNKMKLSIDKVLMAGFVLKQFKHTLIFGQQLLAKNYESMEMLYYLLLSALGERDLYLALSLIKNSKILNEPEIAEYHVWENTNYTNILMLPIHSLYSRLTLVLMVFCEGLGREQSYGSNQDANYLYVRWFDLLNMLYEMGYPEEMMEELKNITTIICPIESN
jgi:hypothetical protein